jgi:FkbM family methyltransferase
MLSSRFLISFFLFFAFSQGEKAENNVEVVVDDSSSTSIPPLPPVLHYFSQDFQDFFLHTQIFHDYPNGTFLDIGAHNGVYYSNSLFFEKFLSWKGICVEPNPEIFQELLKNRPDAINLNYAITDINNDLDSDGTAAVPATADFYLGQGFADMISGLKTHYHPAHLERLEKELASSPGNLSTIIIEVPIKRLADIIQEYHLSRIHYLSIDVEGAEFSVLKSIDWPEYSILNDSDSLFIDVISYENHNSYSDETLHQIRSYLVEKGYIYLSNLPNTQDSIVIHRNSPFFRESLLSAFQTHPQSEFYSQSQAYLESQATQSEMSSSFAASSSSLPTAPLEAIQTILNAFFLKDFKNGIFVTYNDDSDDDSTTASLDKNTNAILKNCVFFEDIFHWEGINILRNPIIFQQLQMNRPNSVFLNYVINEGEDDINKRQKVNPEEGSGDESSPDREEREPSTTPVFEAQEESLRQFELNPSVVKTKRFDEIFQQYSLSHIHYLSLNNEARSRKDRKPAYLVVLQSVNWEKTYVDIITFQKLGYSEDEMDEILSFLFDKGYYSIANIPTVQHKILIHHNSPFLKHVRYHSA